MLQRCWDTKVALLRKGRPFGSEERGAEGRSPPESSEEEPGSSGEEEGARGRV
jgi:hypothetical protein